jgi:hypothetical protein
MLIKVLLAVIDDQSGARIMLEGDYLMKILIYTNDGINAYNER